MSIPIVTQCDFSRIFAANPVRDPRTNKKTVRIFRDDSSVNASNQIKIQMCADETRPLVTKYGLDRVMGDGDPTRRGQAVIIDDPATIDSLVKFDERMVQLALEKSKEWFGKQLTEDQVRDRYRGVMARESEEADWVMKFKVKCAGAAVPTNLSRFAGEDQVVKCGPEVLENRGAKIVPLLSAYSVYFLGTDKFGVTWQAEDILVVEGGAERDGMSKFTLRNKYKVIEDPSPDVLCDDDGMAPPSSKRPREYEEPAAIELVEGGAM